MDEYEVANDGGLAVELRRMRAELAAMRAVFQGRNQALEMAMRAIEEDAYARGCSAGREEGFREGYDQARRDHGLPTPTPRRKRHNPGWSVISGGAGLVAGAALSLGRRGTQHAGTAAALTALAAAGTATAVISLSPATTTAPQAISSPSAVVSQPARIVSGPAHSLSAHPASLRHAGYAKPEHTKLRVSSSATPSVSPSSSTAGSVATSPSPVSSSTVPGLVEGSLGSQAPQGTPSSQSQSSAPSQQQLAPTGGPQPGASQLGQPAPAVAPEPVPSVQHPQGMASAVTGAVGHLTGGVVKLLDGLL